MALRDSDSSKSVLTKESDQTNLDSEFNFMAGINDKKKKSKNIDS